MNEAAGMPECDPDADWYGRILTDDCPTCGHLYLWHQRDHRCHLCAIWAGIWETQARTARRP
jgi:hypothetical protein